MLLSLRLKFRFPDFSSCALAQQKIILSPYAIFWMSLKIRCLSQSLLLAKVNWKSQLEFSILVVSEMSQKQLSLQRFSAAHSASIHNIRKHKTKLRFGCFSLKKNILLDWFSSG